MQDVNKQLLDAVKHCHGIFDQYVSHHLAKPDYDKAAANERHRAICAEAIASAEQAQQADHIGGVNEMAQQAKPVALSLPFFVYDSETGFERFATEAKAKAAAQESIEAYREDAGEEWAEEVENICWGVVLGTTREVALPDEYSGGSGLADDIKPVYYVLADAAQPPAVADLRAKLEEAEHHRDCLARSIRNAAVKAGIIHADTAVEGPQLLMLADNLGEAAMSPAVAVAVPDEIECDAAPWMSADTEPDIAYRDGWNACRAAMLTAQTTTKEQQK